MADEAPVSFSGKKRKATASQALKQGGKICIIHFKDVIGEKIIPLKNQTKAQLLKYHQLHVQGRVTEGFSHIVENFPSELDDEIHGYHRKCYQAFTNNVRIKRKFKLIETTQAEEEEEEEEETDIFQHSPKKKRKRHDTCKASTVLLPSDKCIICDKKKKKLRCGTFDKLVKCETKAAETSIKENAVSKNNVEVLGRVEHLDLVAREAHYHESCLKDLVRDQKRHSGRTKEPTKMKEAYSDAYDHIFKYVQDKIISGAQVERVAMLRERLLSYMQEHHPEYYNPNHNPQKLKDKLIEHFGGEIQFWAPNYRSELIYCSNLPVGQAVEVGFVAAASEERRLEEAAMILRRKILDDFYHSSPCPWPPTSSYLSSNQTKPPDSLLSFTKTVLSGKRSSSEKKRELQLRSLRTYAMQ